MEVFFDLRRVPHILLSLYCYEMKLFISIIFKKKAQTKKWNKYGAAVGEQT